MRVAHLIQRVEHHYHVARHACFFPKCCAQCRSNTVYPARTSYNITSARIELVDFDHVVGHAGYNDRMTRMFRNLSSIFVTLATTFRVGVE